MWMQLTQREAEQVRLGSARPGTINLTVLVMLQGRLQMRGVAGELELTERELRDVQTAARRWQWGGERAFKAVLSAADRHQ